MSDPSHGYEEAAAEFMRRREGSLVGIATLRKWARSLPKGGAILDLGCGSGAPIAEALAGDGFDIHGVDASERLAEAFRKRLPRAPIACEPIETSRFFDRTFPAVIAIGVLFLLPEDVQQAVVRKVSRALDPHGRFLFTSPTQRCTWTDVLTGRESRSPGTAAFRAMFDAERLDLVAEYEDSGGNHYYDVVRPGSRL